MIHLNRLGFCSIFFFSLLLFCSQSETITGAGSGVISDLDSTLTDLDGAFRPAVLDSGDIQKAYSIPNDAPVTHRADYLLIGENGAEYAFGHMQFEITDSLPVPNTSYTKDDTLKGAALFFETIGGIGDSGVVNIYSSPEFDSLVPGNDTDAELLGSVKLADNSTDSISLPEDLQKQIFEARTDSTKELTFSFSISDTPELMKVKNPYIIVDVKDKKGKTVRDSIGSTTHFTFYEKDEALDSLSAIPLASYPSQRITVFEINTEDIFSKMNDASGITYSEVLNAVITLELQEGMVDSVLEASDIDLQFLLFDKELEIDSLRKHFASSRHHDLHSSFTLSVRSPVQKLLRGAQKPLYAYIRLSHSKSGYRKVVWSKPPKFEVVLTPTR